MDNRNWTIKFYFIIIEINKIFMNFKVLIYFDIYIIITGKTLFLITLKFFHTLQQGYPNDFWSGPVCDDIIVGGPGASPPGKFLNLGLWIGISVFWGKYKNLFTVYFTFSCAEGWAGVAWGPWVHKRRKKHKNKMGVVFRHYQGSDYSILICFLGKDPCICFL